LPSYTATSLCDFQSLTPLLHHDENAELRAWKQVRCSLAANMHTCSSLPHCHTDFEIFGIGNFAIFPCHWREEQRQKNGGHANIGEKNINFPPRASRDATFALKDDFFLSLHLRPDLYGPSSLYFMMNPSKSSY
jgi:hypothetical protein